LIPKRTSRAGSLLDPKTHLLDHKTHLTGMVAHGRDRPYGFSRTPSGTVFFEVSRTSCWTVFL
jgi:hypothetical protein